MARPRLRGNCEVEIADDGNVRLMLSRTARALGYVELDGEELGRIVGCMLKVLSLMEGSLSDEAVEVLLKVAGDEVLTAAEQEVLRRVEQRFHRTAE